MAKDKERLSIINYKVMAKSFLFHPTHRKFIRLLRLHADQGTIVNITDKDKKRLSEVFRRTNIAIERHRAIYKLVLEILNRNTSPEDGVPLTHGDVDTVEKQFAQAEHKSPCNTFKGVLIRPIL